MSGIRISRWKSCKRSSIWYNTSMGIHDIIFLMTWHPSALSCPMSSMLLFTFYNWLLSIEVPMLKSFKLTLLNFARHKPCTPCFQWIGVWWQIIIPLRSIINSNRYWHSIAGHTTWCILSHKIIIMNCVLIISGSRKPSLSLQKCLSISFSNLFATDAQKIVPSCQLLFLLILINIKHIHCLLLVLLIII
jgi:hypothetical protein